MHIHIYIFTLFTFPFSDSIESEAFDEDACLAKHASWLEMLEQATEKLPFAVVVVDMQVRTTLVRGMCVCVCVCVCVCMCVCVCVCVYIYVYIYIYMYIYIYIYIYI